MATSKKQAVIDKLEQQFNDCSAVLLTEYRGLSVAQLTDLRKRLSGVASYSVTKNTLARIAAHRVGIEFLDEDLTGPTALVLVTGEAVDAAKALRDFGKENEQLVVKSGVMDGNYLSPDDVKALAELESRDVMLAKTAGVMKAKMVQAAYMFKAPASKMVRTIDALREKQEKEAA